MNANRVKQLFVEFALRIPDSATSAPERSDSEPAVRQNIGTLVVRGNLTLTDEAADAYLEMLNEASEIVTPDGTWSRASLDDLLADAVSNVLKANEESRDEATRREANRIVEVLKTSAHEWQVDMAVAELSADCAGLTFGMLRFLYDTVRNRAENPDENSDEGKVTSVFVRVCMMAVDNESAREAAAVLADRHLSVMNALFSDWQPSRIRLYRGLPEPFIRKNIIRAMKVGDDKPALHFESTLTRTPLSRSEFEGFVGVRGGARVSELLTQDHTFADRVVAGYVAAGTACVEPNPALAFLLFAVALECAVLGEQIKTEITYQLSARVAHLLAQTVDARRAVVKRVNELYRLRSEIVHSGKNTVSESDLYEIRRMCLVGLSVLANSPNFAKMKDTEELDRWFQDRMLSGN